MAADGKIKFAIIGSGWRSGCFLKTAELLADRVEVSGIVSRSAEKRKDLSAKWGIPAFADSGELLDKTNPEFLLVSVAKEAKLKVMKELLPLNIPLLLETPPAADIDELNVLYALAGNHKARIQVAEQFWLHPLQQARLNIIASGRLGEIHYVHVSVNHNYHNISLIRKLLGIRFDNAEIYARSFLSPIIKGPWRNGPPEKEEFVYGDHMIGLLNFGKKRALFDFENNQHRSWIRSDRVLIRGERGEINDRRVSYLKDYLTPFYSDLQSIRTGGDGDFEGYHLKGIVCFDEWVYRNETIPARLADEEIAQASCLFKMKEYVESGNSFYSLAEASQDQYLAKMLIKAVEEGKAIKTENQSWYG